MMKLLLDNTVYAQASKERLQETHKSIKAKGHINKSKDVFLYSFCKTFRAVKTQPSPEFNKALSSAQVSPGAVVSRVERVMRAAIMRLLRAVDSRSEPISTDALHKAANDRGKGAAGGATEDNNDNSTVFRSACESAHEGTIASANEDLAIRASIAAEPLVTR
jgi:hypothetical protein